MPEYVAPSGGSHRILESEVTGEVSLVAAQHDRRLGVAVLEADGDGVHQAAAQGTRFFRISGPAATTIIAFRPDGMLVWSNALP